MNHDGKLCTERIEAVLYENQTVACTVQGENEVFLLGMLAALANTVAMKIGLSIETVAEFLLKKDVVEDITEEEPHES